MSSVPPVPSASGRLAGLDAARVMELALGPAGQVTPSGGPCPVPPIEDLAALLPEYEIEAIIGRGGMGAVYRAVQKKLARTVAIKVLPVELGDEPGFAERFRREAMTTAGLAHPDIVSVYDTGETVAGHFYYVMEFVNGEDLAQRMARGRPAVEESVGLLAAVCGAAEAAHARGIVHRDIKPSNILLTKDGRPRLADFGLALLTEKHLEYSRLTLGGTTLGTLEYAAPEQLAGAGATAASDLYSLGVLTYELLTGELPRGVFDPPSVRNPEVDAAFDGVVLRALQSDPRRRYDSVVEFREALLQAADRRAQRARRERDSRRKLRRRTMVATAAAVVAAGTVVLAGFALEQRHRAIAGEAAAATQRDAAKLTRAEAEKLVEFMLVELQGRLFEVNRLDVLEQVVGKVAAYYATVPAADRQDDEFQSRHAEFIELRGALLDKQGRHREALECYREAQSIRAPLLARHSGHSTWLNSFCEGEFALALALAGQKDYDGAIASHQRIIDAVSGESGGRRGDPDSPAVLMSRAIQAELLAETGRNAEARSLSAATLARLDGLLRDTDKEGEFGWQNIKAVLLRQLAGDAAKRRELNHAANYDRQRMEIFLRFLPADSRNGYREMVFAEAALSAAKRLLETGEPAAAEQAAVGAHAVYHRLAGDAPDSSDHDRAADAARVWSAARKAQNLGDSQDALHDNANGWLTARRGGGGAKEAALFAALLANPGDEDIQLAWAMASEEHGKRIEASNGAAAAMEYYRGQLAKIEAAARSASGDSWWNLGVSYTLNRLGDLHERTGAAAEAEAPYRRAFALRRRLLAAHPDNSRCARNVASSALHLSRVLIALQRPEEAAAVVRPLLTEMKTSPADSRNGWREVLANAGAETAAALPPEAARALAAETVAFLPAPGEAALTARERECLERLKEIEGQ